MNTISTSGGFGFDAAQVIAVLTAVVIVPLGVITFYLRALRDHQLAARDDLTRRIEHGEESLRRVSMRVTDMERDYALKEDWIRESMLARANIERLSACVARIGGVQNGATTPSPSIEPDGSSVYEGTD